MTDAPMQKVKDAHAMLIEKRKKEKKKSVNSAHDVTAVGCCDEEMASRHVGTRSQLHFDSEFSLNIFVFRD